MGVQVVLNQHDGLGLGKVNIAGFLEHMGVINGPAVRGRLDMAPTLEWREQHEQIGGAIAFVFMVVAGGDARRHWHEGTGFGSELLGGFVKTNEWPAAIMGAGVERQNIFHGRHESRVRFGRNDPVFAQMRFEMVFLSARPTVLK